MHACFTESWEHWAIEFLKNMNRSVTVGSIWVRLNNWYGMACSLPTLLCTMSSASALAVLVSFWKNVAISFRKSLAKASCTHVTCMRAPFIYSADQHALQRRVLSYDVHGHAALEHLCNFQSRRKQEFTWTK